MKLKVRKQVLPLAMSALFAGSAFAAVSADEAKHLGGAVLTAFGAEKGGNKDGTIPAYTGEGVKAPGQVNPKDPARPDPFAHEKPLFSITAQNYTQHADKLDAMVELFKKYPNFRMDIYPTHRTATFPKWVADNTLKNATACKGVDNDLKLEGCYGGMTFPIPKNGTQVMWNHLTAFQAQAWAGASLTYMVANNGTPILTSGNAVWQQSWYYDPSVKTPLQPDTTYWAARVDQIAPARKVGEKLVLIDPLDTIGVGRRAYQYVPGQRRVKLAPDLAYDTPSPTAGGVMLMDEAKVFLGALDRYDWKLIGKKEKYIMYNNFKLTDHTSCNSSKLLTKNFPNPDCVRWELHRVWVVEAKVKQNFRHVYPRRVFFWDEDGYAAGSAENYDAANKLYRLNMTTAWPFWNGEGGGMASDGNFVLDMQTGSWVINGLLSDPGYGWYVDKANSKTLYSPEALAGEGIR